MVLRVSSQSDPRKVARAIAAMIYQHGEADVHAIGANAVHRAVKAITLARGVTAPRGYNLVFIPAFAKVTLNGQERTVIRLIVKGKK